MVSDMSTVRFQYAFGSIPDTAGELVFPVGRTAGGALKLIDLAKAPHVLFAGTTGSGKSVGLNVAISTILQRSEAEFVMIDPKRVELSLYRGARKVRAVVTDMDDAADQIEAVVAQMEARYTKFEAARVRSLADYNKLGHNLGPLILVVDELSDLMDTHRSRVLPGLVRLAQLGRSAGIHMMLATQRPAADTIPKKLLGNIPTRIAFRTQSHTESRLILGEKGAEDLKGAGDLLAMIPGESGHTRAQGAFIADFEIEEIVEADRDTTMADIVTDIDEDPQEDLSVDESPVELDLETGGESEKIATLLGQILAAQGQAEVDPGQYERIVELEREVARLELTISELELDKRDLARELDHAQRAFGREKQDAAHLMLVAEGRDAESADRRRQVRQVIERAEELSGNAAWWYLGATLVTLGAILTLGVEAAYVFLPILAVVITLAGIAEKGEWKKVKEQWHNNSRTSTSSTSPRGRG